MKFSPQNKAEIIAVLSWCCFIGLWIFLFSFSLQQPETRRIQGVVTSISASEFIIDISRSLYLPHPDHKDVTQYVFPYDRKTNFRLDRYIQIDGVFVATDGTPVVPVTEMLLGDTVNVFFDSETGVAREVYIAAPVLWY